MDAPVEPARPYPQSPSTRQTPKWLLPRLPAERWRIRKAGGRKRTMRAGPLEANWKRSAALAGETRGGAKAADGPRSLTLAAHLSHLSRPRESLTERPSQCDES